MSYQKLKASLKIWLSEKNPRLKLGVGGLILGLPTAALAHSNVWRGIGVAAAVMGVVVFIIRNNVKLSRVLGRIGGALCLFGALSLHITFVGGLDAGTGIMCLVLLVISKPSKFKSHI